MKENNTVGIIVAMEKEMNLLLPLMTEMTVKEIGNKKYYCGKIENRNVVAVLCGIGKVNAALTCVSLIDNFNIDLVINTGVAGGTGNGAKMLDVVVADSVAYHDVWCGPDTKWGVAADCPDFFSTHKPTLELIKNVIKGNAGFHIGLIASGDIFVSHKEDIDRIRELYPEAQAVDMESASIAHVCYLKNIPFVSIRVISDTPGAEDNIAQYESFWDDAPRNAFNILNSILKII